MVENCDFFIPPLHSTPPFRGFLSEYYHPVWYGKTRMMRLTDSEKILRICITVYTQYRRVTDRPTDRQTSCHGIVRAMHARRAVINGCVECRWCVKNSRFSTSIWSITKWSRVITIWTVCYSLSHVNRQPSMRCKQYSLMNGTDTYQ